jgi:hypothetical protein
MKLSSSMLIIKIIFIHVIQNLIHVPISCMWWSSYNMVQNPSLRSISLMWSSSATWACFHPWTNLTSMLNFIHIVISYIVMGLGLYGNAIKIIIFIHNGQMSINVVKVSFMILFNFCYTIYRSTSHVVNFIHVESFIHVTKFIQFIYGIHVLEHKPPTLMAHPIITFQVY